MSVMALTRPVIALEHRGVARPRRLTADGLLIVYVVLLFAVPSNITITGMGTLGRPALLWSLVLLIWWAMTRLQGQSDGGSGPVQPVRWAMGVFFVIVLISFAAAMLRGQPADQVSPALTALIRIGGMGGVVLVTMEGIRTPNEMIRVIRVLLVAAGSTALLGVAQFLSGSSLLEWLVSVPGLSYDWGGIDNRGAFVRSAGTSTHPLEFVASLTMLLPLAIAAAITGGFTPKSARRGLWTGVTLAILFVCLISVSRSAIVGIVAAVLLLFPWLPTAYRLVGAVAGLLATALVVMLVPGMWGATAALFIGAADDSSTLSRTGALDRIPDFLGPSPFIGVGWGTFMSRYYVFDNQWAGALVEVGVLGVAALLGVVAAAAWSAVSAARTTPFPETRLVGGAVAAGIMTAAVLFLFFDGLSFPISAGVFVILVGLSASLRRIASHDTALEWHTFPRRSPVPPDGGRA